MNLSTGGRAHAVVNYSSRCRRRVVRPSKRVGVRRLGPRIWVNAFGTQHVASFGGKRCNESGPCSHD